MPGPRTSPFGLRNLLRFVRTPLEALEGLKSRYGDRVMLRMAGRPWVLLSHPDDIEAVLVKHHADMLRDEYIVVLKRALGEGLLTSEGELWKKQRKLAASAFTPKRIRSYGDAMVEVTEHGLSRVRTGQSVNLHEEMSHLTMEVVARVLFGTGVSMSDVDTVRESMEVLNEFFAQSPEAVFRVPGWVPTPRNRRVNAAVKRLDTLVYRIIDERRSEVARGGEHRSDLLGHLLAATDDDGASMDDVQLRDEVITLFLAGHETTALALTHTFYALAKNPEIEKRFHAELSQVIGARTPSADDYAHLPLTENIVKEAMRLYPPAWLTGRELAREREIAGVMLPKGTQILMSEWVVQRDPRWFPEPLRFDPDRFSAEATKARPRFAYFPFGGGPRVCIGNHFAMMEAVLMAACIASRFRIAIDSSQDLRFAPSVTLRPKGAGIMGRFEARAQSASRAAEQARG